MKASGYVIVIGRQFGSRGRRIGRALADRLGISYYDKTLLSEAAARHGFCKEIFADADERKPGFLRSLTGLAFGADSWSAPGLSSEKIYLAQSRAIRDIICSGPCVIVGRTADYIGRDLPNLASIFLHSPLEKRARYIVERGDSPTLKEAMELARKRDKEREGYYNYYTGRHWGTADNYHLCIDSSTMSDDAVVDVITAYLEGRKHSDAAKH